MQSQPENGGAGRRGRLRRGRVSSQNYSEEDVEILLDCVAQYELIGSNEWALVASLYAEEAGRMQRPTRDQPCLKLKFDKLANSTQKTEDIYCPPAVRQAKHIARDILTNIVPSQLGTIRLMAPKGS